MMMHDASRAAAVFKRLHLRHKIMGINTRQARHIADAITMAAVASRARGGEGANVGVISLLIHRN